jgi:hypothetical protein
LYINGLKVDSKLIGSEGGFEFSDIALTNGENIFYAISVDSAGNQSPQSAEQSILFKKTGPELEITDPKDGQEYGKNIQNIQIIGKTDIGAQVRINDRFVPVADDGSFIYNFKLSDGENQITVKAFDTAGNQTEKILKVTYKPE